VLDVAIDTPVNGFHMAPMNSNDNNTLAKRLTGRYGPLALTRAAGEAAAARRKGDRETTAFWLGVVANLRQSIASGSSHA
jgi:hypothetical protein